MANQMKVHLFRVRTAQDAEPLQDLLGRIQADSIEDRLRTIGIQKQEIRIESIRAPGQDGNNTPYWFLDFTKLRFDHGPGKVSRDEPIEGFELNDDEGFGEESAVLFDPTTGHALIQYNHNGPRSGTIEEYLCFYDNAVVGKYSLLPVLDDTANVRLAQKDIIKKIQFKVAAPRITDAQRNGNVPLGRVLDLADNLDGETIEVTVSAGRGNLTANVVQGLIGTLRNLIPVGHGADDSALKTFKVSGKAGVQGDTDEINMLLAKEEVTIDGLQSGADRRYTQASRWTGLQRARNGWNGKIQNP
ncbi:DUF6731 family protein [Duganella fentianensis]|uniref:DUF6731 family protein n=1 Tax=Duganella fentianensis TaxID=2692177 RepID=UPI0032B172DA